MEWFDEQLVASLRHYIDTGVVKVLLNTEEFDNSLMHSFPFVLGRIDWRAVPGHKFVHINGDLTIGATQIRHFLDDLVKEQQIVRSAKVIYLGDACDVGLCLDFASFLDLLPLIFDLPQHHYLIPSTCVWCVHYTFENDLFFGRSPVRYARADSE
jgi:hypothetical protein